MTGKEKDQITRALAGAVADVRIRGTSIQLTDRDVEIIREDIVDAVGEQLGELLGFDQERFEMLMDVHRMTA